MIRLKKVKLYQLEKLKNVVARKAVSPRGNYTFFDLEKNTQEELKLIARFNLLLAWMESKQGERKEKSVYIKRAFSDCRHELYRRNNSSFRLNLAPEKIFCPSEGVEVEREFINPLQESEEKLERARLAIALQETRKALAVFWQYSASQRAKIARRSDMAILRLASRVMQGDGHLTDKKYRALYMRIRALTKRVAIGREILETIARIEAI